jgi:excinuclease ABC subunit B
MRQQVLLGVTGSGKTFTMAKVIEQVQKPALILAHNKTLAAQLYAEMREFLPNNAVEYFVSYYDYYQPEAYIPRTDTYIEKDADQRGDRPPAPGRDQRAAQPARCGDRRLGLVHLWPGQPAGLRPRRAAADGRRDGAPQQLLRHLVEIYYDRNDNVLQRGRFRVRGDVLELQPADKETAYRISLWGDEIERITEINPLTGEMLADHQQVDIFPAKHFVTPQDRLEDRHPGDPDGTGGAGGTV